MVAKRIGAFCQMTIGLAKKKVTTLIDNITANEELVQLHHSLYRKPIFEKNSWAEAGMSAQRIPNNGGCNHVGEAPPPFLMWVNA